jgi:heterodisulfide reductase subunit C
VVRRAQLGLGDEILPSDDLWLCSTCYTCYERCPRGVEVVDIIMALRNLAVREGYMAEVHSNIVRSLIKNGCSIPLTAEIRNIRKKLGLDEIPRTVLSYEKALRDLKKIIARTGLEKLIGEV